MSSPSAAKSSGVLFRVLQGKRRPVSLDRGRGKRGPRGKAKMFDRKKILLWQRDCGDIFHPRTRQLLGGTMWDAARINFKGATTSKGTTKNPIPRQQLSSFTSYVIRVKAPKTPSKRVGNINLILGKRVTIASTQICLPPPKKKSLSCAGRRASWICCACTLLCWCLIRLCWGTLPMNTCSYKKTPTF